MTSGGWTQEWVCDLLNHARQAQPGWSWKLNVRPETLALLDPKPGAVSHPDPGLAPLDILTFDGCELAALNLLWDIVLASAVDTHGFSPNQVVPSFRQTQLRTLIHAQAAVRRAARWTPPRRCDHTTGANPPPCSPAAAARRATAIEAGHAV